jgi:hypothetical protein
MLIFCGDSWFCTIENTPGSGAVVKEKPSSIVVFIHTSWCNVGVLLSADFQKK